MNKSFIVYLLVAAAVSVSAYIAPTFTPDAILYAANTLLLSDPDPARVHQKLYESLIAEVGPVRDRQLLLGSEWQTAMRNDPRYLMEELPIYANRPLYLELAHLLVNTGMPVFKALRLISAVSLFGIACTLLVWLRQPLFAFLLLLPSSVLALGKMYTPDALSTLLILAGLYLASNLKILPAFALLLASVFVRTDNSIMAVCVSIMLMIGGELKARYALSLSALAAIIALGVNQFSGYYGWQAAFANATKVIIGPAERSFHLSAGGYFWKLFLGLRSLFPSTELAIWILVAIFAMKLLPPGSKMRMILWASASALVGRYLLYPFPEDRYFAWAYLIAGISLVLALSGWSRNEFAAETSPLSG